MLNPNVRSLNLATAVGIVLYEALRQTGALTMSAPQVRLPTQIQSDSLPVLWQLLGGEVVRCLGFASAEFCNRSISVSSEQ